jgi:hypothetical protein
MVDDNVVAVRAAMVDTARQMLTERYYTMKETNPILTFPTTEDVLVEADKYLKFVMEI